MKWKVEKEAGLTTHIRGSQTSLTGVSLLCPIPGKSEIAEVLKGETGLDDSVLPRRRVGAARSTSTGRGGVSAGAGPGAGRRLPLRAQPWARDPVPAVQTTSPASGTLQPARSRGPAHSRCFLLCAALHRHPLWELAAGALACREGLGGAQRRGPGGCGPGRPES